MKKIISLLFVLAAAGIPASAGAYTLGSYVQGSDRDLGMGIHYYTNVFDSAQKGVGRQTEYYYEYTPNNEAVPVVINGSQIYGKRTITQAAEYMLRTGQTPLAGINADYFSFKTGIPMGHTLMNGDIVTKDGTGMNAIGFRNDGTAFISWLQMMTTIRSSDSQAEVDNINKWCQPGMTGMYMLSDFFGASTKTSSDCTFVILSPVSGRLKIGDTVTLRVDERFSYNGDIAIPKGKYILVMDNSKGNRASLAFLNSLDPGENVTITCTSVYDSELWQSAEYGIGSIGGRLIDKGSVKTNFPAGGGASPRSAVGIKADGSVIFYAIDGRRQGHSYGVQLGTLARRMAELGCVDAINLDGGGSTAIGSAFPGESFKVVNIPSDGALRYCANYLFLTVKDNTSGPSAPAAEPVTAPTSPAFVLYKPADNNFLSGAYYGAEYDVFDAYGNELTDATADISVTPYESAAAQLCDDGTWRISGRGYVTVNASAQGIADDYTIYVFETPDDILVYNGENEINEIRAVRGEQAVFELDAEAFLNAAHLRAQNDCFSWELTDGLGTITQNGILTLNTERAARGMLTVRAGAYSEGIPVIISERAPLADIGTHWAKNHISALYEDRILNGSYYGENIYFYPDDSMTRAQFAVMICAYLDTDTSVYTTSPFNDSSTFTGWMSGSINAVYALGIMNGRTDGTFAPNDNITRAEAAAVIARMQSITSGGNTDIIFADDYDIPSWAKQPVYALRDLGIINGYYDNTFRPLGKITRAEAAALIYKLKYGN